jgi:hypothetical protein
VVKKLPAERSYKKMELELEIPESCRCGFKNFYVWGTRINGKTRIEVRCMSCGRKNGIVTL